MSKFDPIRALMDSDSYKQSHRAMQLPGETSVLANLTPRGSRDGGTHVVTYGLQAFLHSWLGTAWEDFFNADEETVVSLFDEFVTSVVGPNTLGTDHIRGLHRLGYLPLRFRALPEGARVPIRVPLFTVENTHPDFAWLPTYIETALLSYVWHPTTVATRSHELRELLDEWALKTTGSTVGVEFQAHDFSARGQHNPEAAAASGSAHLLSFRGSDTNASIRFIDENYSGDNGWIMGSVPASEHSSMVTAGKDNEEETYARLMTTFPSGILSVVSDTWDLWNVLTVILPNLKEQIMARDGKLVIRPDSGNPVDIITGYVWADGLVPDGLPVEKGVIELLWDEFGGTVNEQGYKVLDSHVGAIYGDGMTVKRITEILERLEAKGFASTNIVFGVGAWFMSGQVTRDTYEFGYKVTDSVVDGMHHDAQKDPITDSGMKKSARGRLTVTLTDSEYGEDYVLRDGAVGAELENTEVNHLEVVWEDGKFVKEYTFAEVRANLGHIV